jgi:hypothetical protein
VKNLEARSQLLDTALASADEANRRWEECRAIVDQLRVENQSLRNEVAQLRQALAQQYVPGMNGSGKDGTGPPEEGAQERVDLMVHEQAREKTKD